MRACFRAALLALCTSVSCASQPTGPYFGDERLLVMGVDAQSEADKVTEQFVHKGSRLSRRLRGEHFVALLFTDEQGERYLRVITAHGIGLALDPQVASPLQRGVRFDLLESPAKSGHDADGDGFEEVFIERIEPPPIEPCILVFRVRDSGFVDPVNGDGYAVAVASAPTQTAWLNPHYCPLEKEPAAVAVPEPRSAPQHEQKSIDSHTAP